MKTTLSDNNNTNNNINNNEQCVQLPSSIFLKCAPLTKKIQSATVIPFIFVRDNIKNQKEIGICKFYMVTYRHHALKFTRVRQKYDIKDIKIFFYLIFLKRFAVIISLHFKNILLFQIEFTRINKLWFYCLKYKKNWNRQNFCWI